MSQNSYLSVLQAFLYTGKPDSAESTVYLQFCYVRSK